MHLDDTRGTLAPRLAQLGGELLIESFEPAEAGALELTEQPEEGVTYAEKIDPAERRLDPSRPAAELERVVRALTPGIGTYLEWKGRSGWASRSARAVDEQLPSRARSRCRRAPARGLRRGRAGAVRWCARRQARDARRRLPARAHATPRVPPRLRMATPARRCAYTVTRRVFEGGAYTDHAFRAEAERLGLNGRDRAFAMRLAYGIVQRRRTLDHVLEAVSDRAVADLDPPWSPRCGWARTSCSTWTASPTTRR